MQFSDAQINQWADEVSDELNKITGQQAQVYKALTAESRSLADEPVVPLVPPQLRERIEAATGESAESFWEKYKVHARRDLCQPDGNLYKMWHQWKDLPSKDVVKLSGGALTAMGLSVSLMGTVGVAASVLFLHVLLNIGINAVCDDGTPPA